MAAHVASVLFSDFIQTLKYVNWMARFRVTAGIRDLDETKDQFSLLANTMPVFASFEGSWAGEHQHFSNKGQLLNAHRGIVQHQFPQTGTYAHIQRSQFYWEDGQEQMIEQRSIFHDDQLIWEKGPFQGCIRETSYGNVLVNITQRTAPQLCLNEFVNVESNGNARLRTRIWLKDGRLFKRTLCYEHRMDNHCSEALCPLAPDCPPSAFDRQM
ncbi:hypothetical protein [Sphingorhabdus sp. EL138]|uniref:hypothetical protein n=1 Tax=Sphingorhabdus sp. EL138 TaxID=2073156 RepID=UPI0013A5A189|nr:hypothetical protein [Sphingorhabdus sp. EL138]